MKPMNFPARKLARQLVADARRKPLDATNALDFANQIAAARAVRTKIKRHARSTKST